MWISIRLDLPTALAVGATLFAFGYVVGRIRTRITQRKKRR